MPSYHQARFIEAALDSVLSQSWPHLELIVQDGGSTDGTQAILARKSADDPRLRWQSAPDKGPADAINQALTKVRGTLIGWLNSDDCYAHGAVERAVRAFEAHPHWMLCYGEGEHMDAGGQTLGRYPTLPTPLGASMGADPVPDKSAFQKGCFICQPTVFFKAVMPRLLGNLDTTLFAAFDFEYWLRVFNAFPGRIGYLPQVQARSRLHDDCITRSQRQRVALEGMQVLARHQGSAQGHWVLTYVSEQRQVGVSETVLQTELQTMLNTVKPWMAATEWRHLQDRLTHKHMPDPGSR
nr:glycosyltransferase family 2 protein [Ectothiorhodospira lacustris]